MIGDAAASAMLAPVDDQRFGAAVRAMRTRRGWRQADLAGAAGISRGSVSRIERGHLAEMSLATVRRAAAALGVRVDLLPRSRDADLDRLVNARHAQLVEAVVRWIGSVPGWVVRPEMSFAHFGERGVIDLVAWHEARRVLLVIEVKTAVIDVGEVLGAFGRKVRLGGEAVAPLGWRPLRIASLLVLAESATNRRAVAAHSATFRSALPDDGRALRGWLRRPDRALHALSFYADARHRGVNAGIRAVKRVRVPAGDRSPGVSRTNHAAPGP